MKRLAAPIAGAILQITVGSAAWAADFPATPPLFKTTPTGSQVKGWIEQYLDQSEWSVIDYSDSLVLMISGQPADVSAYPLVKDWIKWERFTNESGTPPRSRIWRVVVNCRTKMSKTTSVTAYSGNNGRGTVVDTWTAPSYAELEEHPPGTLGEAYVEAVCAAAEPGR